MLSRRGLFTSLFDRVREVGQEVAEGADPAPPPKVRTFPVHRPPGAVAEEDFLTRCTRCGDCIRACPEEAIQLAPARMRSAAGTPIIVANESPCRHCEGTPCSTVCQPDVLRSDYPQKMGTASISQMDCLAWQRSFCTICEEQCPVPGAITLDAGRPVIDAQACTGCGICLYACPAPRKAILLLPQATRPPWKESPNHGATDRT